jgi:hypothetical protein
MEGRQGELPALIEGQQWKLWFAGAMLAVAGAGFSMPDGIGSRRRRRVRSDGALLRQLGVGKYLSARTAQRRSLRSKLIGRTCEVRFAPRTNR